MLSFQFDFLIFTLQYNKAYISFDFDWIDLHSINNFTIQLTNST